MSQIIDENNQWTDIGRDLVTIMEEELTEIRKLNGFKQLDTVDFTFLVHNCIEDVMRTERLGWAEDHCDD